MGLSIRQNFGMIVFMGSMEIEGNGWDGKRPPKENERKERKKCGVLGGQFA